MESFHLYRATAPQTSIEAAEKLDVNKLEHIVLGVIASFPDGCISDDVRDACWEWHGIVSYSSVTARFSALERKNLIVYTGDTRKGRSGRSQRIMQAVHKPFQRRLW